MGSRHLTLAVAAVGIAAATVVLAQDQPKATGVVAVRQATMKANGDHMAAIKAILTEYPQLISRRRVPRGGDQGGGRVRTPTCSHREATSSRPRPSR